MRFGNVAFSKARGLICGQMTGGVASGGRSGVGGGGGDADTVDPSLSSHHLLASVLQVCDDAMRTNYISFF